MRREEAVHHMCQLPQWPRTGDHKPLVTLKGTPGRGRARVRLSPAASRPVAAALQGWSTRPPARRPVTAPKAQSGMPAGTSSYDSGGRAPVPPSALPYRRVAAQSPLPAATPAAPHPSYRSWLPLPVAAHIWAHSYSTVTNGSARKQCQCIYSTFAMVNTALTSDEP